MCCVMFIRQMARQSLYEDRLRRLQDEIGNKQRLIDGLRRTLGAHAPTTCAADKDNEDYDSSTVADARH